MKLPTIQNFTACILIPARGGSKRIKDKNLQIIGGEKLLDWAIENSIELGIDCLISTDSQKIRDEYILEMVLDRPAEYATDEDRWGWLEYHHRVGELNYDLIAVRQCTSPFVMTETIQKCFELAAFTGKCVGTIIHAMDKIEAKKTGGLYVIPSRMIPSKEYRVHTSWLYVSVDRYEAIDIDEPEDLERAREAYKEMERNEEMFNKQEGTG